MAHAISQQDLCATFKNAILRSTPTFQFRKMIRCHLSMLMDQNKLRIADVARLTGLNRSTITALHKETVTRIELPAVECLCALFKCKVGDLFEYVPDKSEGSI